MPQSNKLRIWEREERLASPHVLENRQGQDITKDKPPLHGSLRIFKLFAKFSGSGYTLLGRYQRSWRRNSATLRWTLCLLWTCLILSLFKALLFNLLPLGTPLSLSSGGGAHIPVVKIWNFAQQTPDCSSHARQFRQRWSRKQLHPVD